MSVNRPMGRKNQRPTTLGELMAYLERNYPKKCIGAHEDPTAAHRYAAKVELVAHLRNLLERDAINYPTQGMEF